MIAAHPMTLLFELRVGASGALLRLWPDLDRSARALSRNAGYALSYLDVSLAMPIRDGLSQLARAFSNETDVLDEDAARQALERAVHHAFSNASLVVRRRLPHDQRVPRWPATMRSGAPDLGRGTLWPYDIETIGMKLGTRRLVLREFLDPHDADADEAWLARHGMAVRRRQDQGPIALYASFDEKLLDEAMAMHRASCTPDDRFQDAARWMGDALGYPRCCVEAFARIRARDEATMLGDLLPSKSRAEVGFLVGATTLIAHAPCSAECAPSFTLANAVLEELDRDHSGFRALWESLSRRMHVIDFEGRCFAMALEGERVTHADELVLPNEGDRSFDRVVRPAEFLRGLEVRTTDHQMAIGDSFHAALFVDQRG